MSKITCSQDIERSTGAKGVFGYVCSMIVPMVAIAVVLSPKADASNCGAGLQLLTRAPSIMQQASKLWGLDYGNLAALSAEFNNAFAVAFEGALAVKDSTRIESEFRILLLAGFDATVRKVIEDGLDDVFKQQNYQPTAIPVKAEAIAGDRAYLGRVPPPALNYRVLGEDGGVEYVLMGNRKQPGEAFFDDQVNNVTNPLIYAVDKDGRMWIHPTIDSNRETIKHPSLVAGEPVLLAGQIVMSGGRITGFSVEGETGGLNSGHYKPPTNAALNGIRSLVERYWKHLSFSLKKQIFLNRDRPEGLIDVIVAPIE